MKVLIVLYSYKILNSPRGIRWRALVDYFIKNNVYVDIVCADWPNTLGYIPSKKLRIFQVRHYGFSFLKKRLTKEVPDSSPHCYSSRKLKNIFYLFFRKIIEIVYRFTWKQIYWPDATCTWFFSALKISAELCRKNRYNAFITVAPPFTAHLVGFILKKKNSNIKWLADYGDPFSLMKKMSINNRILYNKLNRFVESSIVNKVDLISVTTEETKRLYQREFKIAPKKIFVAPPLINLRENSTKSKVIEFDRQEGIHCVYTGKFYKMIRTPEKLLATFTELKKISDKPIFLHIFGDIKEVKQTFNQYKKSLGNVLKIHGIVPKSIANEVLCKANVLINVSNNSMVQLPSKVVEYMATGKPIVNFANTNNDLSAKILSNYPFQLNISTDVKPTEAAHKLYKFIVEYRGKKLSLVEKTPFIKQFLPSSVGNIYLLKLNLNQF